LVPVRPSTSRSASSNVTRGSSDSPYRLPLILSDTGLAGANAAGRAAPGAETRAAAGSCGSAKAEAAAAALCKKPRRLGRAGAPSGSQAGSFDAAAGCSDMAHAPPAGRP